MTVRMLKELLDPIEDSTDVVLWVGDWGLTPAREFVIKDHCYECHEGKLFLPRLDTPIACPHCNGTGKHKQVILGD